MVTVNPFKKKKQIKKIRQVRVNLTFQFVKFVQNTKGQDRKKERSNFISKDTS